jgi:hypothetical protein
LPTVACPALHFQHYLIKARVSKTLMELEKYALIFSTNLSETFSILRRTKQGTIKNVYAPSCEDPLFLSDFNEA